MIIDPTCMQSDSELEFLVRLVPDFERFDRLQQSQGHPRNLPRVVQPVPVGQPGHHHVRVTDRLNLKK